jgi:arylsulfatase A-like enzyme
MQRLGQSLALLLTALLAVIPINTVSSAETAKGQPPNILLILTDDQGYADVGVNGHPVLKTPNMDRLATEGLRFTQFQACAECSPSRAGIMTGRNPFKIGVTHTSFGRYYLPEQQETLADLLKKAGYQTAIVGKWHLGTHLPSRPQDKGFDYSFIHDGGALAALQNCPWKQSYANPGFLRNGSAVQTRGFGTEVEINDSIRWLQTERDAGRPFFLYLACTAPHDPYTPPAADMQRFLDMGWDPRLAGFYGLIENLDRHVGRLMDFLESSGLAENTLVVFMGDNGTAASHHTEWAQNGLSPWNAGLYGGKAGAGRRAPCGFPVLSAGRERSPKEASAMNWRCITISCLHSSI